MTQERLNLSTRERSQYQQLTPLDYMCLRGLIVRALDSWLRGASDPSSNLVRNILLLFLFVPDD